jgi:hypothetical protein
MFGSSRSCEFGVPSSQFRNLLIRRGLRVQKQFGNSTEPVH